jgi:hypothetical protein
MAVVSLLASCCLLSERSCDVLDFHFTLMVNDNHVLLSWLCDGGRRRGSKQWTQERAQLTAQAASARDALSRLERTHDAERVQAIREVTIAQTQRDEQRAAAVSREADLKRELEQAQGIHPLVNDRRCMGVPVCACACMCVHVCACAIVPYSVNEM